MKQFLREPLVHFLVLGLLVFLANIYWTGGQSADERSIHVSKSVLARLDDTWLRTTGRAPTEEDRKGLINQYVQEEALAREAQRLGMAEDDEIIKRRLAQKMRFFTLGDESDVGPSDSELKSWFEKNRDQFKIAEQRSFNHVYFSPERHGAELEKVASIALENINKGNDWKTLGDPFMQKRSYAAQPKAEVVRNFGPDFAESIFALPKGQWSKPIGSAFGLHLVRIEAVDHATNADFTANRDRIHSAYIEAQSEIRQQEQIGRIVDRYQVVVADKGTDK